MTGRELIIYILENKLEDVDIFDTSLKSMFMSIDEAAVEFECGPATIKALIDIGRLNGIKIGDKYYIFRSWKDWLNMKDKLSVVFATIASICFVGGLMIITHPVDENIQNMKTSETTNK